MTLEPPSFFESGTPGLKIQCLNHEAIVPLFKPCTHYGFNSACVFNKYQEQEKLKVIEEEK